MIPWRANDGTSARADDRSGGAPGRPIISGRRDISSSAVGAATSIGTAVPANSASARNQRDRWTVIVPSKRRGRSG